MVAAAAPARAETASSRVTSVRAAAPVSARPCDAGALPPAIAASAALPSRPIAARSAFSRSPPTAASRTLTPCVSHRCLRSLSLMLAHHHRLDLRQELGGGERRDAEGGGERQAGAEVPADHRAGDHPELAAEAQREVPDLPALDGLPAGSAAPGSPGTLCAQAAQ